MACDRMDWHYGGDFPEGLPPENGGTHIGMFLCWCIQNGLSGEFHDEESSDELSAVREREMTGREFLQSMCDEKFWEEDLNDEGNRFAKAYYEAPDSESASAYLEDYGSILGESVPSLYHVEDTWENFDRLAERINARYQKFTQSGTVEL